MAAFPFSALSLILVLASSTRFEAAEGFTLEQTVQKLIVNHNEMRENFEEKMFNLENKVIRLEEKVKEQEAILFSLKRDWSTSENVDTNLNLCQNAVHRTCNEVRAFDSSLISGMYWIDPDGKDVGDDPIHVFCNMTTGSTAVLHDSESPMDVGHCRDRGCYSRKINYSASDKQIATLKELSIECHQSIKYDCNFAPIEFYNVTYSWWNDRNGDPQYFWSGNNASLRTCQCGIDGNCYEPSMKCNCDSVVPVPLSDVGIITDTNILPITRLNFGRTSLPISSGIHTLGRLECSGKIPVVGMPKSCRDLRLIGHSLSGLYSVMGADEKVESIYCDFTKLHTDLGLQTLLRDELKVNVTQLQSIVGELKTENQQQEQIIIDLQATVIEVEANVVFQLQSKVGELKTENQQQEKKIVDLQKQILIADRHRNATRIPKSCRNLRNNGHTANGLYLIRGTEKVETVYCDFTALPSPRTFEICGEGNISADDGYIQSPNYPNDYSHNIDCRSIIQIPLGRLQFTLLNMNTESCCDHLTVYDGPSTSNTTLLLANGTLKSSRTVYSTSNQILVRFKTDGSATGKGWLAVFQNYIVETGALSDTGYTGQVE